MMTTLLRTLPVLFLAAFSTTSGQMIELVTPIEGIPEVDYHIVNYVDHDSGSGIADFRCGSKTYDGHEGTDFTLKSFRQMDSGVAILAAASGRVTRLVDTLFDRNKVSVVSRGFGNWIEIRHPDGWYTYYAHLKTGSAVVEVGDSVTAGEKIAEVGSSGNSSDPHLHFEVWRLVPTLYDPYGPGACSEDSTLFVDPVRYSTDYAMIDHGLLDFIPTLDTLRERPAEPETFDEPAEVVAFWAHQVGLPAGSRISLVWERRSDDVLWFRYDAEALDRDFWYHYFWSWINMPSDDEYRVRYLVDDREVLRRDFDVGGATSVEEGRPDAGTSLQGYELADIGENYSIITIRPLENGTSISDDLTDLRLTLFDIEGRHVADLSPTSVAPGFTLVSMHGVAPTFGAYILRVDGPHGTMAIPVHAGAVR